MESLFKNGCTQFWFNAQNMDADTRKKVIKYITKLSPYNCSFVEYDAKYFMAQLIHRSECYFNKSGRTERVKEFDRLGWYDGIGQLDFERVMA